MLASFLCAIHCAATPILMAFGALGGLAFLQDHTLESAVVGGSAILAVLSLIPSYLHRHRKRDALSLAIAGFLLLGISHWLGHEWSLPYVEAGLSTLGGSMIAFAHWVNHKLPRESPEEGHPTATLNSLYAKMADAWGKL